MAYRREFGFSFRQVRKRSGFALSLLLIFSVLMPFAGTPLAAQKQGGGSFVQPDVVSKPKRRDPARPATRPRSLAACVIAEVTVAKTKKSGRNWDPDGDNNRPAPDILITNRISKASSGVCENSYRCRLRINNPPASLSLEIFDQDTTFHDLIGRGNCALSAGACKLGLANVRLKAC